MNRGVISGPQAFGGVDLSVKEPFGVAGGGVEAGGKAVFGLSNDFRSIQTGGVSFGGGVVIGAGTPVTGTAGVGFTSGTFHISDLFRYFKK